MCQWFSSSGKVFTRLLGFAFLLRLLKVTSTTAFQSQQGVQNEQDMNENTKQSLSETYLDESTIKQWRTLSLADIQLSEFQWQLDLRQKSRLNPKNELKVTSKFESKFKPLFPDAVNIVEFLTNEESGIHLINENGKDHIKLNGFQIDLSKLTDYFYLIVSFYPIRYFDELTLMNLPLTQSAADAIGVILTDQILMKRLTISNCVLHKEVNKNSFYEYFSLPSLSHLKLVGCKGIERILPRINDSLEALILEDNEMEIDFGQLTELISRFKNLNQLSVNRNGILTYGFDNFFDFVYSKLELASLSLINDGIFTSFIEKLCVSKPNSSVKTLTISYATDNSDLCSMRDLDKFRSLEKITLPHEIFNESFFPSLTSYFKGQHKLKSVAVLKNSLKEIVPFKIVEGAEKVLFDLRNIKFGLTSKTSFRQKQKFTSVFVDEIFKWDEKRCSSSFLKLPEMRKLQCYSPDGATLKAFIKSTSKLETLIVRCDNLSGYVRNALSLDDYTIPTLNCLEIHRENRRIEKEDLEGIVLFILHNQSIVNLTFYFAHSTIFDKMSSLANLNQKKYSIEEFTVYRVKLGDLECFFDCLSYMPKLRILNASYVSESRKIVFRNPPNLVPLKIEQLVIEFHSIKTKDSKGSKMSGYSSNPNLLLPLLQNAPQLRVLTVKNLEERNLIEVIESLHKVPNLMHLKIISCGATTGTIQLLIEQLMSLQWFSQLDVHFDKKDHCYKRLSKLNLPFQGKINLNYRDE